MQPLPPEQSNLEEDHEFSSYLGDLDPINGSIVSIAYENDEFWLTSVASDSPVEVMDKVNDVDPWTTNQTHTVPLYNVATESKESHTKAQGSRPTFHEGLCQMNDILSHDDGTPHSRQNAIADPWNRVEAAPAMAVPHSSIGFTCHAMTVEKIAQSCQVPRAELAPFTEPYRCFNPGAPSQVHTDSPLQDWNGNASPGNYVPSNAARVGHFAESDGLPEQAVLSSDKFATSLLQSSDIGPSVSLLSHQPPRTLECTRRPFGSWGAPQGATFGAATLAGEGTLGLFHPMNAPRDPPLVGPKHGDFEPEYGLTSKDVIPRNSVASMCLIKPKRPLSPYNYFFRFERQRLLGGREANPIPALHEAHILDYYNRITDVVHFQRLVLQEQWTRNAVKRKHVKTHGLISFGDLTKRVAAIWKLLPHTVKDVFRAISKQDYERYTREMKQYSNSTRP